MFSTVGVQDDWSVRLRATNSCFVKGFAPEQQWGKTVCVVVAEGLCGESYRSHLSSQEILVSQPNIFAVETSWILSECASTSSATRRSCKLPLRTSGSCLCALQASCNWKRERERVLSTVGVQDDWSVRLRAGSIHIAPVTRNYLHVFCIGKVG